MNPELIKTSGKLLEELRGLEKPGLGHVSSAIAHAVAVKRCLEQALAANEEEAKLKAAGENPPAELLAKNKTR